MATFEWTLQIAGSSSERSAEIEAIHSRIDGYDTALAELVKMSERVDDNLRRLRGEDERLRRIDEQRSALQERIAGLDSTAVSIEGRQSGWRADLDKRLDELQDRIDALERHATHARSRC